MSTPAESLHVTKIEVTSRPTELVPTMRPSPSIPILIDGVRIPHDIGVSWVGDGSGPLRLEINGADVMYPTELWIDGVLRCRDEGWLSRNKRQVTVYP